MSEFEIQQLIIASRWEFDVPTLVLIFVSMGGMSVGITRPQSLPVLSVRLLQIAFLIVVGFLYIRAFAAIVRLRKVSYLLIENEPAFEYWNISIQMPTFWLRNALFIMVPLITLLLLERSKRAGA